MKGGAVGLTLLVLLASAPVGNASPSVVVRGPISILGDADFTAANGVVSGTGTPADPFVIAGWDVRSGVGHAIVVSNTTASFVVRDNVVDGARTGVWISQSTGEVAVLDNRFTVRETGVTVVGVDATLRGNHFLRGSSVGTGISLSRSDALVVNNTFNALFNGVVASEGSPTIVGNDVNAACFGVQVRLVADATIEGNVVTNAPTAIDVIQSTRVAVRANLVLDATTAVRLSTVKDADVDANEVRASKGAAITADLSSGNVTANVVLDGAADGIVLLRSPLLVADNRVEANLGVGILLSSSNAVVSGNEADLNGVGIRLTGGDRSHLEGNVLVDNAIGLDVPYESRQAVPHMSGNVVNGVAVDAGASRVYFYHAANVLVSGQVRDSGHSAGRFGSLTAQGNVVLYEVDGALVEATTLSHAAAGLTAINSFDVVLEGATLLDVQTGVVAQARAVAHPVPACAVSVKNSTINFTVDPPLTVGVDARGCLVNVRGSTVANFDVGIRYDAATWGNVSGNLLIDNRLGLDVVGRGSEVTVIGNVVAHNRVGARFAASAAVVLDNRFEANAGAGVQLDAGSSLRFAGNEVVANGEGVVDVRACGSLLFGGSCSSVDAQANLVVGNRGDGYRVNGTSRFRGDVVAGNDGTGIRANAATLVRVHAESNGGDGASLTGAIDVSASNFTANARHGLRFQGSGNIRASNFTFNGEAGIRATATYAIAIGINASFNGDGVLFDELVPVPTLPPVQVPPVSVPNLGGQQHPDPMDIHRSVLLGNARDAIRAGAAVVNATHNWFGGAPTVSALDAVGAYQNGISPTVRFVPWYEDEAMTTTGPVPLL